MISLRFLVKYKDGAKSILEVKDSFLLVNKTEQKFKLVILLTDNVPRCACIWKANFSFLPMKWQFLPQFPILSPF